MSHSPVVIQLDLPAIPLAEYARRSGQTIKHSESQVKQGKLPILQEMPKAKVYVNLIAMAKTCAEAAQWNNRAPSSEYSL